jgi:hypothetical protein
MSHALHTALEVMVALSSLAILIWPGVVANDDGLDANDPDHTRIP